MSLTGQQFVKDIAIVVYDGVDGLHVTNIADILDFANLELNRQGLCQQDCYQVRTTSNNLNPIVTLAKAELTIDESFSFDKNYHAVFIAGGDYESGLKNSSLLKLLKDQVSKIPFIAGICEASFLLAEAGLLSGRNATTYGLLCDQLSNGYPEVNVLKDRLLVQDGKIFTSSGRLSCIDLALELIKQDWGKDFSLYVSRYFSIYLANTKSIYRKGYSETTLAPVDTKIKLLNDWITAHLDQDLRVDELAFQAAMSPRNFARWISQRTGVSPARYIESIRFERAKFLLETSDYSLEWIAEKTGFVTLQTLRRVFARRLNIAPKDYRKAFNKKNIQQFALNGPDPISGFFDVLSSTETELQQSGQYDLESDLPFRSIYQQAASGILIIRIMDGHIVIGNPAICRMMQYSAKELSKLSIEDIHPYDQLKTVLASYAKLKSEELSCWQDVPVLRKDGSIFYADITASIFLVKFERCLIIYLHDVTDRRNAENKLAETHQRLTLAIRAGKVGLWDLNLVTNETFYSSEWKSQLGYQDDELPNHFEEWSSRLHPEDKGNTLSYLANFLENKKQHYEIEFRLRHKDGSYRWILSNASVFNDDNNNPVRMLGSHIDITEFKQQQQSFKVLFEQSPLGIAKIDSKTGQFLNVNPAYCTLIGYSQQDLFNKTFMDISYPEDLTADLVNMERLRREEITHFELTKRLIHKNGQLLWIELFVSALWIPGSKNKTHMAVIHDVSERKRLESELQQNEENLRILIAQAPVAIAMFDCNMRYLAVSDRWLKDYSVRESNVIGCSHYDIFPEIPEVWKTVHKRAINGETIHCDEDAFLRDDGNIQWLSWIVQPWHRNNGCIGGISIVTKDITEQVRNQRQVQAFQRMIELASDPFYVVDLDDGCRMAHVNTAAIRHFGISAEKLYKKHLPDWDPNYQASDLPELVRKILKTGSLILNTQHLISGGKVIPVEVSVNHFCDHQGKQLAFGWIKDLSERQRAENELLEREQLLKQSVEKANHLQEALDHVPAYVYVKDKNSRYIYGNQHMLILFQCSSDELSGVDDSQFFPPDVVQHIKESDSRVFAGETVEEEMEFTDEHGDRHVYWNMKTMVKSKENGEVLGLLGITTDISKRRLLEDDLRLAASVFENSHDGILISNPDAHILDVNPAFSEITGYSRQEVLGQNPRILSSGQQDSIFYDALWQQLTESGTWRGEIINRKKNGELCSEWLTISAVKDETGRVVNYIGAFTDISLLKQRESELQRAAFYDSLTGIPNRVMLADRLNQAIAFAKRKHSQFALAYLDLDGFKPVNDQFGHDAGDELLKVVVERIKNALRESDTLARIGGDEFIILLTDIPEQIEYVNLLNRILSVINQPIPLNGNDLVTVTASIGVTLYPHDNAEAGILLRHADQAMYHAKLAGKNCFHVYDPILDQNFQARQSTLDELARALRNGEFQLFYQPKLDLQNQRVIGAEALIRWRHSSNGLLTPDHFLPIIENTDLENAIGQWVINTALQQLQEWHLSGLPLQVSININGDHLQQPNFVYELQKSLQKYPELPTNSLQIEVLETVALKDFENVTQIMSACQKLGIGFALDDFGTGYSSLAYLRNLPIETVKIDQAFIRDMLVDQGDQAIVRGILALTETFKLNSVAEGIESEGQLQWLRELGCHYGQGYFIAPPMPAEDFSNWYLAKAKSASYE